MKLLVVLHGYTGENGYQHKPQWSDEVVVDAVASEGLFSRLKTEALQRGKPKADYAVVHQVVVLSP